MNRVRFGLASCPTMPWTWIWEIQSRHNLDICRRSRKSPNLESTTDWSLTPVETHATDETPSIVLNFDADTPSRLISKKKSFKFA
jgi:hypothetical protein